MGELAGVVLRTALDAGYLLAAGVLPPLIAGIVLQFVTSLFGVCCIEVFGIRFCVWATAQTAGRPYTSIIRRMGFFG